MASSEARQSEVVVKEEDEQEGAVDPLRRDEVDKGVAVVGDTVADKGRQEEARRRSIASDTLAVVAVAIGNIGLDSSGEGRRDRRHPGEEYGSDTATVRRREEARSHEVLLARTCSGSRAAGGSSLLGREAREERCGERVVLSSKRAHVVVVGCCRLPHDYSMRRQTLWA